MYNVYFQIMERDRKLDTALLQTGKFKDALLSIMDWLGETEEMVTNQKPPSVEYKVTKAQMQEQKVSNLPDFLICCHFLLT